MTREASCPQTSFSNACCRRVVIGLAFGALALSLGGGLSGGRAPAPQALARFPGVTASARRNPQNVGNGEQRQPAAVLAAVQKKIWKFPSWKTGGPRQDTPAPRLQPLRSLRPAGFTLAVARAPARTGAHCPFYEPRQQGRTGLTRPSSPPHHRPHQRECGDGGRTRLVGPFTCGSSAVPRPCRCPMQAPRPWRCP